MIYESPDVLNYQVTNIEIRKFIENIDICLNNLQIRQVQKNEETSINITNE